MFVVRCSLFVTSTSSAHRSASVCSLGFVIWCIMRKPYQSLFKNMKPANHFCNG